MGVKNPIGDPLRMKACFLRVSITDPPSLAGLENSILTHIFLTQCFPILLPYKNTELIHTAVIQQNFSRICCGILTPLWPFSALPYWDLLDFKPIFIANNAAQINKKIKVINFSFQFRRISGVRAMPCRPMWGNPRQSWILNSTSWIPDSNR